MVWPMLQAAMRQLVAESGHCLAGERLDDAMSAAHLGGGLGDVEADEEAQRNDRALARRQRCDGVSYRQGDGGLLDACVRFAVPPVGTPLRASAAVAGGGEVERDPAQSGSAVVHGAYPRPVGAGAFQRLLGELLRDVAVAGQEGQQAGELRILGLAEGELLVHLLSPSGHGRIPTPRPSLTGALP